MEIQYKQNNQKAKFFIDKNGEELAQIAITFINSSTISIDHTEVNEQLKEQGIAKQLLFKVVEFSRDRQLKIVPVCSYAAHILKKDDSFQDVLQDQ